MFGQNIMVMGTCGGGVFSPHVGQEEKAETRRGQWTLYPHRRNHPPLSDLLLLARPHLLHFPEPSKIAPIAWEPHEYGEFHVEIIKLFFINMH
jgi:hypothetical protein